MNTQSITIFGNYRSDVEGFDDERAKHSISTKINKRPIDIMRDIYANFVAMEPGTKLILKGFGDHLPMLCKICKRLKALEVKLDLLSHFDDTGLIVLEVEIMSEIPIKFIQQEAFVLKKSGYGDDSKFALEDVKNA